MFSLFHPGFPCFFSDITPLEMITLTKEAGVLPASLFSADPPTGRFCRHC
ncbi:hypothetical protein HOLDEFILI_00368 [Holdemania filiformis DSM 12042]|uniref:Uncharacterized protein n=1 Tax=Holdemania filiformis DSM 12042 TaxID=545696 RepID=B9Y3J2_9FIRM|nr:hypothetical protein HOLDEFILI_00368 [Holdemania filiformis DSM 12042]